MEGWRLWWFYFVFPGSRERQNLWGRKYLELCASVVWWMVHWVAEEDGGNAELYAWCWPWHCQCYSSHLYTNQEAKHTHFNHKITESQDGWGLYGPVGPSHPTSAPAEMPRGGMSRSTTRWLLDISREETPQPHWAACASTPSPTQYRSASWYSDITFCAWAHCLQAWHWAPLIKI